MRSWQAIVAAVTTGTALTGTGPAAAADFDGKAPMICAATDLRSCAAARECGPETPESLNAPRFLRINVADKAISGTRPGGEPRTTPVRFEHHEGGRMLLAGVDGPLSWHIDIDEATGDMMLAANGVGPDGPFTAVIYGACILP